MHSDPIELARAIQHADWSEQRRLISRTRHLVMDSRKAVLESRGLMGEVEKLLTNGSGSEGGPSITSGFVD
jgi:hypothetical protein